LGNDEADGYTRKNEMANFLKTGNLENRLVRRYLLNSAWQPEK